jgi:hypothetical protein
LADGQAREHTIESRYYHLRLTNEKRANVANQAQVIMTAIEKQGPNGQPQVVYDVPLPLTWQYQQHLDPTPHRMVGAQSHIADLLFVRKDGLYLTPMVVPSNFEGHFKAEPVIFWVTVQARSVEAYSKPLRLEIAWNGKWDRGKAEMADHLTIKPTKSEP